MSDRKKTFKTFIDKRMYNFSYLARAHGSEGEASPHWMNIMKLELEDINRGSGAIKWLPLALAVGEAWKCEDEEFLPTLIGIFEFFNAERRYKSSPEKIAKHMEKVNFEGDLPETDISLPFNISYSEAIITICDVMSKVYEKLGKSTDKQIESRSYRSKVEKFDGLVKSLILVKLCNSMNNQCSSKAQQIMYSMDSLYALNKVRHF